MTVLTMARRSNSVAYLTCAAIAALCCHELWAFMSAPSVSSRPSLPARLTRNCLRGEAVALKASAMDAETMEDDSIELSGFAGFIVGLALLPYVVNCFYIDFTVIMGSEFTAGPFYLSWTSCLVTLGIVFWSVGSLFERGRGLPAGFLGLLGFSEGLSYIAVLGLAVAVVASNVRSAPSSSGKSSPSTVAVPTIQAPQFQAPDLKVPGFKAPDVKLPEIKAPDVKLPEFKAPDVKVPEFKAPEIKVPEFKAPDIKVPDLKVPEVKIPEEKLPTPLKAQEAKKPDVKPVEAKKAEPAKVPEPVKKESPKADYDDLFG